MITIQEQQHEGIEFLMAQPQQVSNKPPILFVHGAYNNGYVWETNLLPYFAKRGHKVYAVHLRNRSEWDKKRTLFSYTLKTYAQKIARLSLFIGNSPIMIGHSMGGLVIQKYMSDYQHRVSGLCLLAAAPPFGTKNTIKMMFANPIMLLKYTMLTLNPRIAKKYPPSDGLLSARSDETTRNQFQQYVKYESAKALMGTVHPKININKVRETPLCILGAANDNLILPKDVVATGKIYGNSAKIYPEMGHFMMLEPDWELMAADIENWLLADTMLRAN